MDALGWAGMATLITAFLLPSRYMWGLETAACLMLAVYAGISGSSVFLVLNLLLAVIACWRWTGLIDD